MNIKKYIPNTITCMNLFSGCIACVMAFQNWYLFAALFIVLAAVFDFFDGMVARLLKAYSNIGKELDSLADMISFGLAPGAIVFNWLSAISEIAFLPYIGFFIPVFSALRLAKFNIDERQTSSFIGLPTPANALFLSFTIALCDPAMPAPGWIDLVWFEYPLRNVCFISCLVIIFSFLLVCELPMFSLKFKNLKWSDNKKQFILIGSSVLLLLVFQLAAIPLIILLFIFMSVYFAILKNNLCNF